MDLLIAINSVPLANADAPPVAGTPQYATDGDAANNVSPTIWPAYWFNGLLQELVGGLIKGTGIVPSATNFSQIAQSVRRYAGGNISKIDATTTLTADNAGLVLVDASGGNVALTLPVAASANGIPLSFSIIRTDTSANAVTYLTQGADTFSPSGSTTGAIPVGGEVEVIGDGVSAWWRPGRGRFLNMQIIKASGIYTKTAGAESALVLGIGAGGGGGSVVATSGNAGAGGGGGAGAFDFLLIPYGLANQNVIIGAGGAGGIGGGNGSAGGESSFGALGTWPGGGGGGGVAAGGSEGLPNAGVGAAAATGTALGLSGNNGNAGLILSASVALSGKGADSPFGSGGGQHGLLNTGSTAGSNASGFGAGGGGSVSVNSATVPGGDGSPGLFLVFEFA